MAIGPDGGRLEVPPPAILAGLNEEQLGFVRGLEGIIDRALERHRAGESFVYGIYQALDPPVMDFLVTRYREAGWSQVKLRPGLTGAYTLVLVP